MNVHGFHVVYEDAIPVLMELMRRAVDGTVIPLFVDYTNNRVIIGATAISSSPVGSLEVAGGDIKIVTTGKGLLLPTRTTGKIGRVILEEPDAGGNLTISVDRLT